MDICELKYRNFFRRYAAGRIWGLVNRGLTASATILRAAARLVILMQDTNQNQKFMNNSGKRTA
jgi:hypothetical protein